VEKPFKKKEIPMQDNTLRDAFASIIENVGEDLDRHGLKDTPQRAADARNFSPRAIPRI